MKKKTNKRKTKIENELTFWTEDDSLIRFNPDKITKQIIFDKDGASSIIIDENFLLLSIYDDENGFDAFLDGKRIIDGWNFAGKRFNFIQYFRRLVDKMTKEKHSRK